MRSIIEQKVFMIAGVFLLTAAASGCKVSNAPNNDLESGSENLEVACEDNGQFYQAGQSFPAGDGCNQCNCREDGSIICTIMSCIDIDTCEYNGESYLVGESFDAGDGCNSCTCGEDGDVLCTLMACIPDPTEIFDEKLSHKDGCDDMFLFAANPHFTTLLSLFIDGILADTIYEGGELTIDVELPSEDLDLELLYGNNLNDTVCKDMPGVTSEILERYLPISGTLSLTTTTTGNSALADVRLVDAVFQLEDSTETILVEDLEINSVKVGL